MGHALAIIPKFSYSGQINFVLPEFVRRRGIEKTADSIGLGGLGELHIQEKRVHAERGFAIWADDGGVACSKRRIKRSWPITAEIRSTACCPNSSPSKPSRDCRSL